MTIFQMYIQMQLCLGTQMTLDELSPATVSMAGWLALAQSVLVCRKRLTGLQMSCTLCLGRPQSNCAAPYCAGLRQAAGAEDAWLQPTHPNPSRPGPRWTHSIPCLASTRMRQLCVQLTNSKGNSSDWMNIWGKQ